MNIAYVHTGQWPSNSPSFTFVTLNSIGLSAEFDNCYLFVKKNSEDGIGKTILDNFDLPLPQNLSIERISFNSTLNTNYFYYKKVVKKLINLIELNKLDVIVTRNSSFLKYTVPIKKKYGIKVFFESHDFYANLSLRNDINIRKKKRFEKNENKYIPQISGVLCLQNVQKKLYENRFPLSSVYIARTGLQDIRNETDRSKYITYIGSLDKHKGVIQLLKALNLSKAKPTLLIIGGKSTSEIENLKLMIREYYDPNLVEITGWIDKKKLSGYLKKTAVGVIPLTETFFNKHLTSPLKLFDYYSYCIPVIATDLPTTRELILEGKTGLFFQDGNISDLASKIDNLILNKEEINQMRLAVYDYAKDFLWTNRAKKLKTIFEESVN